MSSKSNRSTLLVKNVIASFFIRGWLAIVVLLMVPLTLKMLGVYTNGIWLTISGILVWIDMLDIGLGNGLRNAVAESVALGDTENVRKAVSSTFFMLVVVIAPILLVLCCIIHFFDMYSALGIDSHYITQLKTILTVAVIISCSTFILKVVGNFYMGLQLPAINNLIQCIGYTLALLLTAIAYYAGSHSLFVVVVINTASPLLVWMFSIPYTFGIKYPQYRPAFHYVNFKMVQSLCSSGFQFFILQICSVILFTSTNIIISRIFSPAEVTPYQIAYRYFSIILTVFTTICIPFWNATTDAYTTGDFVWIRKMGKKLDLVVVGSFICLVPMVLISGYVYKMWIGDGVHIPFSLSVSMAVYIFILIASLRYSYILNGINVLKIQLIFTIFATIVFLPLALLACKSYGTVTSLVLVMCIVNIPGLIANMWKYRQIFLKKNICKL